MSRIVFVGLPGTGKTALARAFAERSGTRAIDTDDIVAERVGTTAAAYLRDQGESSFRACELEALREALEQEDVVVATGGGVVVTEGARELLIEEITLWLDCDDEVILARLGDAERPLLDGDRATSLAQLRQDRSDWYRDVSRARIDTSTTFDDVLEHVSREVDRLTR